jgi:hypothetical protein
MMLITFSGAKSPEAESVFTGTYAADQSQIQIDINADHSFSYYDNSAGKHIRVSGRWAAHGRTIKLLHPNSKVSIFDKWKIDERSGCVCIRSQKALEWRRICKKK